MGKKIKAFTIFERLLGIAFILLATSIALNIWPTGKKIILDATVIAPAVTGLCLFYRSNIAKLIGRLRIKKFTVSGFEVELDAVQSIYMGGDYIDPKETVKWLGVLFAETLAKIDKTLIDLAGPAFSSADGDEYKRAEAAASHLTYTSELRNQALLSYLYLKKIDASLRLSLEKPDETSMLKSLSLATALHREIKELQKNKLAHA